jgi:hypothetical protein
MVCNVAGGREEKFPVYGKASGFQPGQCMQSIAALGLQGNFSCPKEAAKFAETAERLVVTALPNKIGSPIREVGSE